jgi:hypothetical protein
MTENLTSTRRSGDAQAGNRTRVVADPGSPPATPRWVKVFGIIGIVLVLLFVGLHLTGNSPMHTPPATGTQHAVQLP